MTYQRSIHLRSKLRSVLECCYKEIGFTSFKDVLKTVEKPYMILAGDFDELLAVSKISRRKRWLVVVYKEGKKDGFIITAYITSDIKWLLKRKMIWIKK